MLSSLAIEPPLTPNPGAYVALTELVSAQDNERNYGDQNSDVVGPKPDRCSDRTCCPKGSQR